MDYAQRLILPSWWARTIAFCRLPAQTPPSPKDRRHSRLHKTLALVVLLLAAVSGCSREHYRRTADEDAYQAIGQKTCDPFWPLEGYTIQPSRESRFYDASDPNFPPMPPDDPAAHKLMHCVDGMCGDGCWHANGNTPYAENACWMRYLPFNERGEVMIDLEGSVRLALLHSPEYQQELEDLYLSALDVTFERFRFDVQFFGSTETFFTADGPLRSGPNGESSSTLEQNTALDASKLFANGAELVVGFANSMVWQFSGPDSNFTTSLLDFSLIQPLLRGGGRARVLERLTIAERTLLANVRTMERYRRGFYVNVVSGRDEGPGPQRRGGLLGGAGLSGFTGVGAGGFGTVGGFAQGGGGGGGGTAGGAGAVQAGGYLGLLQDAQQIRNQEATVAALADSLAQLEAAYEAGRIDRFQVDLARQALFNTRSQLMINRANYQSTLDRFKFTLGLPPHLELAVDDPLLSPFQLIDPVIPPLQNRLTTLQQTIGNQIIVLREQAAADAVSDANFLESVAALRRSFNAARAVQQEGAAHIPSVRVDIGELQTNLPERVSGLEKLRGVGLGGGQASGHVIEPPAEPTAKPQPALTREGAEAADEIDGIIAELRELPSKLLRDLQATSALFRQHPAELESLDSEMAWLEANIDRRQTQEYRDRLNAVLGRIPDKLVDLSSDVLELSLIQARARAESVTLLPIDLDPAEALLIASRNRYDWMNAKVGLVDTWRLIEFNANDLLSELNLVFSGDVRNVGDNPLDFRATTGRLRVGAQFDAPLTRMAERNNYRQALIEYQQARRNYYRFIDTVSQALRQNLRGLDLNEANFELRRAAVRVAIDQVEITRLRLRQPPQPGVVAALGNTTARDLVSALSDLQSVQNDFLSVWVNHEVERLNLDFNLGTMQIDNRGMWVDPRSAAGANALDPYAWLACRKYGCTPCDFAPAAQQTPEEIGPSDAAPHDADGSTPPLPPPNLLPQGEELPPPQGTDAESLRWPAGPDAAHSGGEGRGTASDAGLQSIERLEKKSRVWPAAGQKPVGNVPANPLRTAAP
ncbi:MAG: TolC family protein [Pirellulales bacterium]